MTPPTLVILAGANGARKTTLAKHDLRAFIAAGTFLNADEIARMTRPEDVGAVALQAGRSMLNKRRKLLGLRESFCVETTLATLTLRGFVLNARDLGYLSRLIFLFTPYSQLNELRVKQRVMAGGHNIDTDTIRRRHTGGLQLLADCWDVCDEAVVFDVRTRHPEEIVRKDMNGFNISSQAGWVWLCNRVLAVGGRVLKVNR